MKILLRLFGVLLLLTLLAGVVLYLALAPPAPLELPDAGVALAGVTVINPGHDRLRNAVLRVEGGTITELRAGPQDAASPAANPSSNPYAGAFVLPGA